MLQAVTKAKLGYDPLEVNPEDMVRFAIEQPQVSLLMVLVCPEDYNALYVHFEAIFQMHFLDCDLLPHISLQLNSSHRFS